MKHQSPNVLYIYIYIFIIQFGNFAGILGTVGALAYGAYAYRNRGPMSTSRYLMRLRVIAQSMVVGAIMVGVGYTAIKEKKENK